MVRESSTHKSSARALVLVGQAACVVAVRVRTVVRVVLVPVAGSHQEGNVPRVCTETVIDVVEGEVEIRLFFGPLRKDLREHENGVCCSHVVTVEAPSRKPDQVVGGDGCNVTEPVCVDGVSKRAAFGFILGAVDSQSAKAVGSALQ